MGDWIVIAIATLLAWWSYSQGQGTVKVADPPRQTDLAIVAHLAQPGAKQASLRDEIPYRADVSVNLSHGCQNPVSVAVSLYPRTSPETTGTSTNIVLKPIRANVAIIDPHVRAFLAQAGPDGGRQFPLAAKKTTVSGSPAGAWVLTTTAQRLIHSELHFGFAADWVRHRTTRSCFVLLPDLSGDDAQNTTNLVHARDPARSGRVALGFRSGTLEPFESVPPPTNLREQSWACEYNARTLTGTPCAGIAVFNEPNATGAAAARIFFYGALFGVFLTLLIETMRRIRLPPPS